MSQFIYRERLLLFCTQRISVSAVHFYSDSFNKREKDLLVELRFLSFFFDVILLLY